MLSMMWQSFKARDLLRDPRVLVHSIVTEREGTEGESRCAAPPDEERTSTAAALRRGVAASLGWRPEPGRFHLFSVDISDVTFIRYDEPTGDQFVASWPPPREFVRRGTTATSVGEPEPVNDLLVPAERSRHARFGAMTALRRRRARALGLRAAQAGPRARAHAVRARPRAGRARRGEPAARRQDPGGRAAERRLRAQPAHPQPRGGADRARPRPGARLRARHRRDRRPRPRPRPPALRAQRRAGAGRAEPGVRRLRGQRPDAAAADPARGQDRSAPTAARSGST